MQQHNFYLINNQFGSPRGNGPSGPFLWAKVLVQVWIKFPEEPQGKQLLTAENT
jgi:hypothetical protein